MSMTGGHNAFEAWNKNIGEQTFSSLKSHLFLNFSTIILVVSDCWSWLTSRTPHSFGGPRAALAAPGRCARAAAGGSGPGQKWVAEGPGKAQSSRCSGDREHWQSGYFPKQKRFSHGRLDEDDEGGVDSLIGSCCADRGQGRNFVGWKGGVVINAQRCRCVCLWEFLINCRLDRFRGERSFWGVCLGSWGPDIGRQWSLLHWWVSKLHIWGPQLECPSIGSCFGVKTCLNRNFNDTFWKKALDKWNIRFYSWCCSLVCCTSHFGPQVWQDGLRSAVIAGSYGAADSFYRQGRDCLHVTGQNHCGDCSQSQQRLLGYEARFKLVRADCQLGHPWIFVTWVVPSLSPTSKLRPQ